MTTTVKLAEIIDTFEFTSYEDTVFINKNTGEVIHMSNEYLRIAEDEEAYGHKVEWEQSLIEKAYDIIDNESNYIAINEFEVREYDIVEQFCLTVEDPYIKEKLLNTIRGKGAFRRFKDMIYQFEIQDDWYDFREAAYEKRAIQFCDRKGLQY